MPQDISWLWHQVDPAVTLFLAGLFGFITKAGNAFLVQHKLSAAQDDFDQAMVHGDALILAWWKSLEAHNSIVTIPEGILSDVASKVLALAPAAEAVLKLTPDTIGSILQANLTKYLHWSLTMMTPMTGIAPAAAPAAAPAPATDAPAAT
jgi:hypothetical protein